MPSLLFARFFSTIFEERRQTQPLSSFVDQVSSVTYQVRTLRIPIQNRIHDHGLVSCACSFAHFQVLLPVSNDVSHHSPALTFLPAVRIDYHCQVIKLKHLTVRHSAITIAYRKFSDVTRTLPIDSVSLPLAFGMLLLAQW